MGFYGLVDDTILTTTRVIPDRPSGNPEDFDDETRYKELFKCTDSPHYFIKNYVKILDDRTRKWIPFDMYPAQINALDIVAREKYVIWLKTRQVGATTLIGGAYFLWLLLFTENAYNLVLSKSEREAQVLMTDRFKPMYRNIPSWMRPAEDKSLPDSKAEFELSNRGKMFSLPTSAGDSYTARACLIDEAALVHESRTALSKVLLAVEPTIAAGGQLFLVSKADKGRPDSTFNSVFNSSIQGEGEFFPLFAPWTAVPWRTQEWYDKKVTLSKSIDGSLDYVHENYPRNFQEALAPRSLDKRLPQDHIEQCFVEMDPLKEKDLWRGPGPDVSNLLIYRQPQSGKRYIITADAAEGNPQSDPSCADVWDWETGEQMAHLSGRYEPSIFGLYLDLIGIYYNMSPVFPERNNHGHALIMWMQEHSDLRLLRGPDSTKNVGKFGYNTSAASKASGYVELATMLREQEILIHNKETARQLNIVEGRTLRAPAKQHDDHALSCMLFGAAKKHVHLEFLLEFV